MTVTTTPQRAVAPSEAGIFRPSARPLAAIALAAVTFVVLLVAGLALRPGQDTGLARDFNSLHTGVVGAFSSAIYEIFSPVPAIILTVLGAAVFWRTRGLRTAMAFGGVVALTWLPTEVLKIVVHRHRPELMPHPYYPVQVDSSFPSGHTAFIVAFVLALVYVLRGGRWRNLAMVLGTLLVVVVAVSIAIDAVHFPSDLAASIVWSLAVAPAARVVWVDWIMPRVPFLAAPALPASTEQAVD